MGKQFQDVIDAVKKSVEQGRNTDINIINDIRENTAIVIFKSGGQEIRLEDLGDKVNVQMALSFDEIIEMLGTNETESKV